MYFCWNDGIRKRTERKRIEVGLLVTVPVESKSSYFEWKLREQIEKCLLYSAIEKSPQTNLWKPRYKDFIVKFKNGDGIWISHSNHSVFSIIEKKEVDC